MLFAFDDEELRVPVWEFRVDDSAKASMDQAIGTIFSAYSRRVTSNNATGGRIDRAGKLSHLSGNFARYCESADDTEERPAIGHLEYHPVVHEFMQACYE